jgi:hypothetical protein
MRPTHARNSVKHFYILAISQKNVRLFHCDLHNVLEMRLDSTGMPGSLQETLKSVERQPQVQAHSAGRGPRKGIFHGNGVGDNDQKVHIEEYFRQVNEALMEVVRNERTPMILAAVEYLIPIFRRAGSYPYVLDEYISGSPDRLTGRQLRDKALGIMKHEIAKERYGLPG